jgi:hypothetical protein
MAIYSSKDSSSAADVISYDQSSHQQSRRQRPASLATGCPPASSSGPDSEKRHALARHGHSEERWGRRSRRRQQISLGHVRLLGLQARGTAAVQKTDTVRLPEVRMLGSSMSVQRTPPTANLLARGNIAALRRYRGRLSGFQVSPPRGSAAAGISAAYFPSSV